jgi:hypothetical protein
MNDALTAREPVSSNLGGQAASNLPKPNLSRNLNTSEKSYYFQLLQPNAIRVKRQFNSLTTGALTKEGSGYD